VASSREDLERLWKSPEVDLTRDIWVVETRDLLIVGYEEFYNRYGNTHLHGDGYVHPQFLGRGIGTSMLRVLAGRAREVMQSAETGMRVFLRNGMAVRDARGRELHENEGYQPIRYSWRMEIKLEAPPTVPVWPVGIALKSFDLQEHNRLVFEADDEAFLDHWGNAPMTFERWQHYLTDRADFDPSLWFIAWDRDQIAGYALCRYRMGIGWVGTLGVRRPWRKRGLGLALLYQCFNDFYYKGMKTVGLGVDAANPTGATRLYKKAGMSVANEYVIYEKELRPGRELTLKED
jgi:mycothiol synthase